MNWIQRKIYLYNVTFGLFMLDWWERCLFNTLMLVLIWFIVRYITDFCSRIPSQFSAYHSPSPSPDIKFPK
ncbi:unnamed protein product [Linum tenue]|uniref:Uncharacterized protein n=1 Tax=Linum tenue TaxID=586396 RepID=A0AAV0LPI6_9ROSI|nr:unnamed protein product [Linum tenue]